MGGPSETGEKGPQERAERTRQVVSEFRSHYDRGEAVSAEAIVAEHQDLMPELGEKLKKVCLVLNAGDEALAQRWTDARKRMDEDTVSFRTGGSSAGASNDAAPTGPLPNTGDEQDLPAQIGKYRVIGLLASGGQAIAYRAADDTLRRDVVVKVSRSARDRAGEREQFFKQGRILGQLGQLNHPNLERVLDCGFDEDRPFLVMDYIGGRNLAQYSRDTRLSPRESAAMVAKIARALAAAHCCGVIHRDIKPHNIVVDKGGEPRLIDFGLALLCDAWQSEPIPSGWLTGTAAYMAPEQARGEEVDARSDVFGLGAVFYFLLTGKAPFAAPSLLAAIDRAKRCDFDRQALNRPGIGRGLRKICLKAMAADREDRYQTAEALARALERWLALRPKWLWSAAAVAVCLVAGAIGVYLLAPRGSAGMAPGAAQSAPPLVQTVPAPADAKIQVTVWQNDAPLPLARAIPLRTGDDLRIECRVPEGLFAALFWLDAAGQLYELPLQVMSDPTPQEPFTRLVWPDPDQANVLAPPPGTEVVLVCAGREAPPSKDEVAPLVGPAQPWPELPERLVVEFDQNSACGGPEPVARGPGNEYRKRLVGAVLERAETLRRRLSERFPVFCGVAFPHVEPDGPAP